mgnify:CR=1 FL=1
MKTQNTNSPSPIYVVSGGRGIGANNVVQALLIQYPENQIPVIIVPNMNNEDELFDTVMKAKTDGGIIVHTMVNTDLRKKVIGYCAEF